MCRVVSASPIPPLGSPPRPLPGRERGAKWQLEIAGCQPSVSAGVHPCETPSSSAPTLRELLRTNDVVLISFVETLLKEAGITTFVADENMSVLEGSVGILPRRVMVPEDRVEDARRLMREAGVGAELERPVS